ncbi:MAG: methyltransferase, partial [Thermomicrobiales bacterium]
GMGVLREESGRDFSLTPAGELLRTDHPESLAGWAEFVGLPYHWQAWGDLLHSVKTGETGFEHNFGIDVWNYRAQHPELSAGFDRAMASNTRQVVASVVDAYDFGRFSKITDVGGGNGALLAAILDRHPQLQGVLFDQPHVVSGAGDVLREAGVADRCQTVGGSFFEGVPPGSDAYVLKSIIHDWDDERSIEILSVCRRAMEPGTTLLLVERDLGAANERPEPKLSDLNMLVMTSGMERTAEEYAAIYGSSGFRFTGVTPTSSGIGIFEGEAV